MKDAEIKDFITRLPDLPGVYKYFDDEQRILYVGKAKNLKKRVSSYFSKQHDHGKTRVLVSKIRHIEFTVVDSETEALLLENNLIKEFQPRYNINLKDDKTYPLIRITKERFPKVFPTRQPVADGSEYFGPYASVRAMHFVLDFVKQLYPIRNCNLALSKKNIEIGKFAVCLEYHLGNCKGPCEGKQTEADYLESIQNIKYVLRGKLGEVKNHLKAEMLEAAEAYRFEEAAQFKDKIELLEKFRSNSVVANHLSGNIDVFNLDTDNKFAFVNFLRVADGMVIQTRTFECKKILDEKPDEILQFAMSEIHSLYGTDIDEVVLPFYPEFLPGNFRITVPKAGEKLKLLELSKKNAMLFRKDRISQYEKLNPEFRVERLLTQMKQDLRLTELPAHIECFDNSNFHGDYAVSACVVFKDGKPAKKDYRHFNVKTVIGPDDFATMREVISRRYSKILQDQEPLPQLIVVDGGKGQLSAAVDAMKEVGIYGKVAVIGIAKKLEELFYPEDSVPLHLDKKSETLKIIQQMRDEAHRFGITHHRKRRNKGGLSSELEAIPGIGEESIQLLLRKFKSLKKIREAGMEELSLAIGNARAGIVFNHYHADHAQE